MQKRSLAKINKTSSFRKEKEATLEYQWLLHRQDNFYSVLRPVRAIQNAICSFSGKTIEAGDYTYPAYENPVRVAPSGKSKVLLSEAVSRIESLIPEGWTAIKLTHPNDFLNSATVRRLKEKRQKALQAEGTRLLKAAGKITR